MAEARLEDVPQVTKYGSEVVLQFTEHYIGSPLTSEVFSAGYAMPLSKEREYNADYFRFEVLPTFLSKHQQAYEEHQNSPQPVPKEGRPKSVIGPGGAMVTKVDPLEESALKEKRGNKAKFVSYTGRCLIYGHQIQLRHKLSGLYLTCSTTSVSPSDPKSLKCVFRRHSSLNSFFSLLPASFSNVEGDIVHDKDFVFFQSSKPRGFLHVSDSAYAVKSSFSLPQFRDINFSSLSSGFVIHNVENAEVDSASLQFGEMVQIYHSGFNAYLSIQDDNIVWLKVRKAALNSDRRSCSPRTYWVLERTDFIYKSPVQWGQPVIIRHFLTNKTLSFKEQQDTCYQFVPASANDIIQQQITNGTNVKIKAVSEEGDQWLSFSSESKGRLVDTCLQPTFSYHGVLTLKRVGERSSWLCFRFSGLALLLQQLVTDANAGFSSSLTHVKEVKQFLMEIIEELGKKEHMREIRKICRDYHITQMAAEVCVTYIKHYGILTNEDFESLDDVIKSCVLIINRFLRLESSKNWSAVQEGVLEVFSSFIQEETFLEYLPALFKRNIYLSSSITLDTIEQFYQTHKILPVGDSLIQFTNVLGMFCKYKTFCIAPNQNTIADLLLLEGTDIAINFGIRIVMGPVIEINVKGEWQELTSETEYYELFLQRIELYTLLSWGNNGYVKSLINQKIEFCTIELCVAVIVETKLPAKLRRYFIRWLISLHIDTSSEGNRFALPSSEVQSVLHPMLVSDPAHLQLLTDWVEAELQEGFYSMDDNDNYGTRYDMIRLIDYLMRARILENITYINMVVTRLFSWLGELVRYDVQKTAGKTVARILRIFLYTADINLRILLENSTRIQSFDKNKGKRPETNIDLGLITWVSEEVQSLNTFLLDSTGISGEEPLVTINIRQHAQLMFSLLDYADTGIGDSVTRIFVKFNLPVTEFLYTSKKMQCFVTTADDTMSRMYKAVTDDVTLLVMLTKTRLPDTEANRIIEAMQRISDSIIQSHDMPGGIDVQGLLYGDNLIEICLTILLTPEVDLCSDLRNSDKVKRGVFWLLSYQMQGHPQSQLKCFNNIDRLLTINTCIQDLAFMISRIFKDNAELCIKASDEMIRTIATHPSISQSEHYAIFKILVNIIRGDEKDESGISINKDIVFNELLKNYDNINNQVFAEDKIKFLKHNLDEGRYISQFYNLLAWCAQGTDNPIATICKGLLDEEHTVEVISSPMIMQRSRRPFVRYLHNVFQDITQHSSTLYSNPQYWQFISNEFAMIDFVCKQFQEGKSDQSLLEGVLYFTSNKKKYNYNSESEEMRENLKFVCTVLLDVFIHTFCCQACVEERVSEGQLADFSKTFEEFTLFIVPFVPGVVRGKIFRVLESLSKYKQQSGQDELITDEAGQVFKLNTRPTDHTLLSGRKQSEVAKVNAPPYYRPRVSMLKLKLQQTEQEVDKLTEVIEKPFTLFVDELSDLLLVQDEETDYTVYSSVPYSHEIRDMARIFEGNQATMEYRLSLLLRYLCNMTKRQFVDQSNAKALIWSAKVYLRSITSLILTSTDKENICSVLIQCKIVHNLSHLLVDKNEEVYRDALILFITVVKSYSPARDSIFNFVSNSNKNYFSRIFQEFRTAREASQEAIVGGGDSWLSVDLQRTLRLTLLYCTALCQTHQHQIQDIFLQQIYSSKSFNLIGELVLLIHYLCMREDTQGLDVLAIQTLKCIISGNESNKENALEYGLSDTLNSIFITHLSNSGSVTKEMAESEQQYELLEAGYLLLYDLIEDSINEHSEVLEKLKSDIDTKALIQTIELLWDSDMSGWIPIQAGQLSPSQEIALEGCKIIKKMGVEMNESLTALFSQYLGSIEIISNAKVEKLYFPLTDDVVRESVEDRLKWGLNRKTGTDKEIDFLLWSKEVIRDLEHQKRVKKYFVLNAMIALDNVMCWDYLVFFIALIIQVWMIAEWDFTTYECLASCVDENSTLLLNQTTETCQLARDVSSEVCVTWQYSLFLLIAGILHLISSVSLATSYFVQNIPHFVLPWYMGGVQDEDKKLMINILSFSPLYMLMVVVFSALGWWSNGYFYCFHLLHMAWVSDLLRRVMTSVLRHWDQLLLCLPLAVVVVYIYTLAFFANFRYIFEAEKMEYCTSLSQCFVTLIKVSFRPSSGTNNLSWSNSLGTFTELWQKIIIDSTFFIIFVTVGLNVVTGIIIDGFRELKSERNKKMADMQSRCTICDIEKDVFTKYDVSWDKHLAEEHNIWNYIQVLYILKCKAEVRLSASEHHVLNMFNKQDIRFLPLKMSMSVERERDARAL